MELRDVLSEKVQENEPKSSFDPDALTRALRIAGAVLVVASASTFMLQHWQVGNDLWRYAMLVGQSLMLAAAAYFVGLTLREGRSARTFLALVLATMPVSFAVLGGLVYSQFHFEKLALLPQYATWVAPNQASALLAVLGTLLLLVPLAVVSFMALARRAAIPLTLAFFAANLLVILPVRQPLVVAALAGVALIGLLRLELTRFTATAQLDTLEGKLARVVLFAPPLIMLGRVFHLYQPTIAFVGGVLMIVSAVLWLLLSRAKSALARDFGSWVATGAAAVGWGLLWSEVCLSVHGSAALNVLTLGLPMSVLALVGSHRAAQSRGGLIGLATILALGTAVVACAVDLGTIAALGCILLGVAVAVWGASVSSLARTASGSLVALYGMGVQVWLAVHHDNFLRWTSLSVVGMLLIVGSAYVDRNRARIARFWEAARVRRLDQVSAEG